VENSPGNANQSPSRGQDQFFTAVVDWVKKGIAPGNIVLTSRNSNISYPVCECPQRKTWNGRGRVAATGSFFCR